MNRKWICLFLVSTILFLSACVTDKPSDPTLSPDDPPLYLATVEYGEPDLITDNSGPLWAYIRFPVAGNTTDAVISKWAHGVYQDARDEIAGLRKDDPDAEGEVNIQFDSYLIDGRYAGILENGMFMSSHLAHPVSIIRTFNIDTKSGALLQNADILDYAQVENILSVLRDSIVKTRPDAADYLDAMDTTWLTHIALGHEGVIVLLEKSLFLPTYFGALMATLPYEALGSAFLLGEKPEPTTEPPTEPPTESKPNPIIPNIPPQSNEIDPSKPMVALTFDDGPSKYTAQILDLLEKYNCRATFCVVGNLVSARKSTVKRASDLGCEIIGHSWDHRDLSKLTAEEIKKELNDTSAAIESVTGSKPMLYRPPYGATNATVKNVSAELGYALIHWSVDPLDWKSKNADKVHSAIMGEVSNRAIVLSHDLYGSTADAMERVIPELLSRGYQLVTVSELMYYSDKTLEAGKIYYYIVKPNSCINAESMIYSYRGVSNAKEKI